MEYFTILIIFLYSPIDRKKKDRMINGIDFDNIPNGINHMYFAAISLMNNKSDILKDNFEQQG